MNFSIKDLLKHVSKGQMIRLIFLYDDGEETGLFLEFENDKLDLEIIIPDYTDLEINGETELQWIIEQVFSNSSDVSQILENIKPRNNIEQEFENRLVDIGWQGNDAVRVRIYGKKLPLN